MRRLEKHTQGQPWHLSTGTKNIHTSTKGPGSLSATVSTGKNGPRQAPKIEFSTAYMLVLALFHSRIAEGAAERIDGMHLELCSPRLSNYRYTKYGGGEEGGGAVGEK